jgi:hypothetical protein
VPSVEEQVRLCAGVVDVPGAPVTLRLDGVSASDDTCEVLWSYTDPEIVPGASEPQGRVAGVTRVTVHETSDTTGERCWAQAQLDAAHEFKYQVDEDWLPGEPPPDPRQWSAPEAWSALRTFLSRDGATVREDDGDLVVTGQHGHTVSYRFEPTAWAAYLTRFAVAVLEAGSPYVVPAAVPEMDGLPLWVADQLIEEAATSQVVLLEDGELRGD